MKCPSCGKMCDCYTEAIKDTGGLARVAPKGVDGVSCSRNYSHLPHGWWQDSGQAWRWCNGQT